MKRYYTIEEAAEVLKLPTWTIYRYVNKGRIRASKMGKIWRISNPALMEFLKTREGTGEGGE